MENFSNVRRKLAAAPNNISFSELDSIPYYEYESLVEDINKEIEKENDRIKAENTGMVEVINFDSSKSANI